MTKDFLNSLALFLAVLIFALGAVLATIAWTEPTSAPPAGNIPAPINVGSQAQTKQGPLTTVGALTSNTALYSPIFYDLDNTSWYVNPSGTSVFSGNVGIGTTSPQAPLHVVGNILAPSNLHDNCYWTSWTCADQQTCNSGYFMAGVERGANSGAALCGTAPRQWYQMRIYCCQI